MQLLKSTLEEIDSRITEAEEWISELKDRMIATKLCPTICDLIDCSPSGCSVHGDSPCKNTGVSCHSLLQGSSGPRY